jgi:hypothetical protein
MAAITEEGELYKILVQHQRQERTKLKGRKPSDVDLDRFLIPYGELCRRAGLEFLTHSVGLPLSRIALWCEQNGKPPLNSLAVNKDTRQPGNGYDGAAGSHIGHWVEEVISTVACEDYPDEMPYPPARHL